MLWIVEGLTLHVGLHAFSALVDGSSLRCDGVSGHCSTFPSAQPRRAHRQRLRVNRVSVMVLQYRGKVQRKISYIFPGGWSMMQSVTLWCRSLGGKTSGWEYSWVGQISSDNPGWQVRSHLGHQWWPIQDSSGPNFRLDEWGSPHHHHHRQHHHQPIDQSC